MYVSIVGIDRIPLPYYERKLETERVIRESGVPFSILRASQFHWLVDWMIARRARVPFLLPVPAGFRMQSVGTGDVAEELLRIVEAAPGGLLPDLAGPEPMNLAEAARTWCAVRGERRIRIPFSIPGAIAAGYRRGYNTVPDRPFGRETWRDWLRKRYGGVDPGR